MKVTEYSSGQFLEIGASAARITIEPKPGWGFELEWERGIPDSNGRSQGIMFLSAEALEAMFGLRNTTEMQKSDGSKRLRRNFPADVAIEGTFLRSENFLTLPIPDLGYFPWPSVSLEISDYMQQCIKELIDKNR